MSASHTWELNLVHRLSYWEGTGSVTWLQGPAYPESGDSMYIRSDGRYLSQQTVSRPRKQRDSYTDFTFHTVPRLFIADGRITMQHTFGSGIFYSICLNIQPYTAHTVGEMGNERMT